MPEYLIGWSALFRWLDRFDAVAIVQMEIERSEAMNISVCCGFSVSNQDTRKQEITSQDPAPWQIYLILEKTMII